MPPDPQDLCRRCGLCCDGTLFESLPVAADAPLPPVLAAFARRFGFIPQPCPCHRGVCTVYAERPSVCAAFRCEVLKDYEQGKIALAEAEALIAQIRKVHDRVFDTIGDAGISHRQNILGFIDAYRDDPGKALSQLDLTLDIAAYKALRARFVKPVAEKGH